MAYFTRIGLLLVAILCFCTAGRAQSNLDYWIEAECTPLEGTGYVTARDFTASNRRYVTVPRGEEEPFADSTDSFLRFPLTVNEPVSSTLTLSVYGRMRTILPAVDYFWVRLNEGDWVTLPSLLFAADTFAWQPPVVLTGLTRGSNTVDVALTATGTELDKLYLTTSTRRPTREGPAAGNCDAEERNLPPVAIAQALPEGGAAPLAVTLDGSWSYDEDGLIESYAWTWNDGGSATGPSPTVTLAAGTYTATLTVTDDFGATGTSEVTVTVGEEPTTLDSLPQTVFWLEAECAAVGSAWSTVQDLAVSGGQSVVVREASGATTTPPADLPANRVRFTLRDALAGSYDLFARINAPNNLSDSYWVRVNAGPWLAWASGMRQAAGYQWNGYPAGPIQLEDGTNYIDFAFREAGTVLDKLHLNQTGKVPMDFGPVATNCTAVEEVASYFALEAECAQRFGNWRPVTDLMVSGGKYTVCIGPNTLDVPTAATPVDSLAFTIDVTQPATYYGYLRLNAPDLGSNSLWLRIDGGNWIEMNQELDGTPLLTSGFAWRTLTDLSQPVSFDLTAGSHTITVANRESGTRLDKLYLSTDAVLPVGLGVAATNCTASPPVVTFPGGPLGPAVSLPTTDLSVYPNPTQAGLSLERYSDYVGPVTVRITDFTGRQLRVRYFEKVAEQFTQTIDLGELPAGMYRLQLLEGGQSIVTPFIRQ